MVVQSSNIGMRSERYYRKREEEVKSLQLWGTSKNGQDELQMGNTLKEGGVDAKEIAEAKNTVKSSRNIQKQEGSELKKSIHQIQAEAITIPVRPLFRGWKRKTYSVGYAWTDKCAGIWRKLSGDQLLFRRGDNFLSARRNG